MVAHPANMQRGKDGTYPFPTLYDISNSAHWSNKADIGVVVHRASLIDARETTIRVVKSRYASEIGIPGEITVVWDEVRTRFGTSCRRRKCRNAERSIQMLHINHSKPKRVRQ